VEESMSVLRILAEIPEGRILIANMHVAAFDDQPHLDLKMISEFLSDCEKKLKGKLPHAAEAPDERKKSAINILKGIYELIWRSPDRYRFKRKPMPIVRDVRLKHVLDLYKFTTGPSSILDQGQLHGAGAAERITPGISHRLARRFNDGKIQKDAMLGMPYDIFFSSCEEKGEGAQRGRTADDARDYYGLIHYDSGQWLFCLSSHWTLQELQRQHDARIAAPSFFEGVDNSRFREKPAVPVNDGWGRAFDLKCLTDTKQSGVGGPEIVMSPVPAAAGFTCTALGHIETSPNTDHHQFAELLRVGLPCWEQMVEDLSRLPDEFCARIGGALDGTVECGTDLA
jgi:hypothetical protein